MDANEIEAISKQLANELMVSRQLGDSLKVGQFGELEQIRDEMAYRIEDFIKRYGMTKKAETLGGEKSG